MPPLGPPSIGFTFVSALRSSCPSLVQSFDFHRVDRLASCHRRAIVRSRRRRSVRSNRSWLVRSPTRLRAFPSSMARSSWFRWYASQSCFLRCSLVVVARSLLACGFRMPPLASVCQSSVHRRLIASLVALGAIRVVPSSSVRRPNRPLPFVDSSANVVAVIALPRFRRGIVIAAMVTPARACSHCWQD